jgi:hypothetical protein
MPAWKLILLFVAWLLASVMIAVVTAIIATEVLKAVGIVESDGASYTVALNAVAGVVLVVLVAVPFVFRRRFTSYEPPPKS